MNMEHTSRLRRVSEPTGDRPPAPTKAWNTKLNVVGFAESRVQGPSKVTGKARVSSKRKRPQRISKIIIAKINFKSRSKCTKPGKR